MRTFRTSCAQCVSPNNPSARTEGTAQAPPRVLKFLKRANYGGSVSAPGARRASFFHHSPLVRVFAPTSPNNLEYLLAVSKNLAHPLHPVYDHGKGGGWKWWE